MAFALQLRASLQLRESQVPIELAKGDPLSDVLTRHLLTVEAAADSDMLTSILLLDGSTLRHCAAPNLPQSYCSAIDGSQIGPGQGSCGTAAFFGRPVYVTDIDADPLWVDYRNLALEHGLRACWSTPIFNDQASVIGTFAVYHLTPRAPTPEEVTAIRTITDHVARAIMLAPSTGLVSGSHVDDKAPSNPVLRLVTGDQATPKTLSIPEFAIDKHTIAQSQAAANGQYDLFVDVALRFEAIARAIDAGIDALPSEQVGSLYLTRLRRAKMAALQAATLARSILRLK